ncbi:MAG: cupin domain-containing protein [Acidimicrobiales bacterium]
MTVADDPDTVRTILELAPHPEGGSYRETWADASGSAIYFLLREGEDSAWHRVHDRVEIWHFYAGAPLLLEIDESGPGTDTAFSVELGTDLAAGQRPQVVVPAGAWQSARSLGAWTLVGCTVTPPFDFEAFELAPGTGPHRSGDGRR